MTPQRAAAILHLKRPWTEESIKKAYKTQSKKTHPDRGGKEEDFKAVATAKTTLEEYLVEIADEQDEPIPRAGQPGPPPPMSGRRRRNTRASPPPGQGAWGRGSYYNTGDARSKAAGHDPYFQNRHRVDPQETYARNARSRAAGRDPYFQGQEPEEEVDVAAAGDNYIVKAMTIDKLQISPSNVRAQLQQINGQYQIAIYFSKPIPIASGLITIILAEDEKDTGSILQNKPITSRSYDAKNWITTLWFSPF